MKKDLSVHITYRNEMLEPVADEIYPFDEYTNMLAHDLLRMISDVEDLVYEATDGDSKVNWRPAVWVRFNKIKHKLCDKAGELSRLTDNLIEGGGSNGKDL